MNILIIHLAQLFFIYRNVLSESARIARGNITDMAKLNVSNHDAVIFPGGFGAAKNL